MSHFSCVAILPNTITDPNDLDAIMTHVAKAMERYSEERAVEPYDETCWCIEKQRHEYVNNKVASEFGDPRYETVVDKFRKTYKGDPGDEAAWEEHIKPATDLLEQATAEAEAAAFAPAPKCFECHGSGKVQSTYNPDSKWDWYQVGGRWDGSLLGLEWTPHLEVCRLCGGSGKRPETMAVNPKLGCNGCGGTGKAEIWPTSNLYSSPDRNICRMSESTLEAPYAVLLPDGEWTARGEMGWFGVSSAEVDVDGWGENWKALRTGTYANNLAVILDCHI